MYAGLPTKDEAWETSLWKEYLSSYSSLALKFQVTFLFLFYFILCGNPVRVRVSVQFTKPRL